MTSKHLRRVALQTLCLAVAFSAMGCTTLQWLRHRQSVMVRQVSWDNADVVALLGADAVKYRILVPRGDLRLTLWVEEWRDGHKVAELPSPLGLRVDKRFRGKHTLLVRLPSADMPGSRILLDGSALQGLGDGNLRFPPKIRWERGMPVDFGEWSTCILGSCRTALDTEICLATFVEARHVDADTPSDLFNLNCREKGGRTIVYKMRLSEDKGAP